jgi:hypothetical protein
VLHFISIKIHQLCMIQYSHSSVDGEYHFLGCWPVSTGKYRVIKILFASDDYNTESYK